MNRRKFLTTGGATVAAVAAIDPLQAIAASNDREIPGYGASDANPLPIVTSANDLTAYSGAWGDVQIRHVVRRATFGASYSQFTAAKNLGSMDAVVAKLLADSPMPPKPGDWVDKLYKADRNGTQLDFQNNQRLNKYMEFSLQGWWFDLMVKEDLSIREKMTLMWSNHFVTGFDVVKASQIMYSYLSMLRRNALGNLKTFVQEMSVDPAMLIYLNGNQNTYKKNGSKIIDNVNENFARELMELFTLGIFDPKDPSIRNYSEEDIQQAARALSGWQVSTADTAPFTGVFHPELHSNETKTFFGQSGNFGMQDIINMIFAKNGGYNVAYYICQKIYSNFVYWVPNPGVVDAMANLLISSNWELKPVMNALLKSAHFYDENVIGAQLKSPAHLMTSLIREFTLTLPAYDGGEPIDSGKKDAQGGIVYQDRNPTQTALIVIMGQTLGQDLLNPPNVKGWAGGHSWVNTGTYPTRKGTAYLAVSYPNYYTGNAPRAKGVKITFDPLSWAHQIPNYLNMTSGEISNALSDAFLAFDLGLSEATILRLVILGGTMDGKDFYLDATRVAQTAQVIATLPEFQLY